MNENVVIGQRIKTIRTDRGMGIVEFGERMKWSPSKVSRVENGKIAISQSDLLALSEMLDISRVDLLKGTPGRTDLEESFVFEEDSLSNQMKWAAELFQVESKGKFEGSSVGKTIGNVLPQLINQKCLVDTRNYLTKGSVGKGQFAEIPWIATFDKKITESAMKGIYIVYLFKKDMSGVYLSLNQGFTYFQNRYGTKKGKEEIRSMASLIRSKIEVPKELSLVEIDLLAEKSLGKGYEAGHIAGKYYDFAKPYFDSEYTADFMDLIDYYQQVSELIGERSAEEFYDYLIAESSGSVALENDEITSNEVEAISPLQEFEDKKSEKAEVLLSKGGKIIYPRDRRRGLQAIALADYKCEYNQEHDTFQAKSTGKPFVEAHHLIPICYSNEFEYSIDVHANIYALCPTCHAAIHLGTDDVKKKIINQLYLKHEERMKKSEIHIGVEEIYRMYDIK